MGSVEVDKAYGYLERCILFLGIFLFLSCFMCYLGVLTYPHSPDYRPDIDALPPVQVRFSHSSNFHLIMLILNFRLSY